MQNQTKAFLYAGMTIAMWSTVSTAFKIALMHMSPLQLITISMAISALLLGIWVVLCKKHTAIWHAPRGECQRAVLSGVLLFMYYMILFSAYDRLPAQIVQPINISWSLMLALLSVVLLKQKLSLKAFFWLLFAYVGILVISIGGNMHFGSINPFGIFLAALSTLLYALYWIFCAKIELKQDLKLTISFASAALCGIVGIFVTKDFFLYEAKILFPALYVALFELSLPFITWALAMQYTTSVSRIASLPLLGPFFALFWVNLILKESIATSTFIGLAFVVFGTYMQQRVQSKTK